jgi:hypothetical protein
LFFIAKSGIFIADLLKIGCLFLRRKFRLKAQGSAYMLGFRANAEDLKKQALQ